LKKSQKLRKQEVSYLLIFIKVQSKACGVVVRASPSQLGDPGSNLGSAKSLLMIG